MFSRTKIEMQKRIEQLEWLICKGQHKWVETEYKVVGTRKEPMQVILITCQNCGKEAYKPIQMAEDKKNPIGFKTE